ncbi:MAG: hypothetical protein HC906_16425 [Bacteroidales bacterium]|nr:hypothetical protein [Bacteroidales bacterium]
MNFREIIEKLSSANRSFSATVGFDACIDNIVKVIKQKNDADDIRYYNGIREFGEFISSKENKSCGLDLRTQVSKPGGNMTIASNALGCLGIKTTCIGTFGTPDVLPIFKSVSPNCELVTVGETVVTTALEFDDGKIMMCDLKPYENLNWQGLKDKVGLDSLIHFFQNKQLISFLNWSEIDQSTSIWQGFIDEILPVFQPQNDKPIFFCDLSDCSPPGPKDEIYQCP